MAEGAGFVAEHDMGPMGVYLIFGDGETQYGGIFTKPKELPVAAWCDYVSVEDIARTAHSRPR